MEIRLINSKGKHYYLVDGEVMTSITTYLNVVDKIALRYFYGKHGIQEANRIGKSAAKLGTRVHKRIQYHFEDKPYNVRGKEIIPMKAFYSWLDDNEVEASFVEWMVASKVYGFAGTMDFVGMYNGKFTMLDFKTSGAVYPEYELQVQAGRVGWEEDGCRCIEQLGVVRFDKLSGKYEVVLYEPSDDVFEVFVAATKLWRWKYGK